jgi:membrane protease YdiL (CAAX protease family)
MTDPENIPQADPIIEPVALDAPASGPGTYPPSWFPSEPPQSPEQIAEQLRLSKIPADLRVPWGWTDVGVFLLIFIGSIVFFGILALLAAAAIQHVGADTLLKAPTVLYINLSLVAQAIAFMVVLFYFFALVRLRRAGDFWPALGWRSLNGTRTNLTAVVRMLFSGVALAFASSVVGLFLKQPKATPIEEFFKARQTVLMLMVFGVLVAPLVEETIFRGFIYPVAARQFGVVPGILFTGILFGGFHAMQLGGAVGQVAIIMGVGIVLTWVRARSGSVLASFLLHVAYNSTLFAAVLIQSHGLRDFPVGK